MTWAIVKASPIAAALATSSVPAPERLRGISELSGIDESDPALRRMVVALDYLEAGMGNMWELEAAFEAFNTEHGFDPSKPS
jgi:hypothetical protein